MHLRRAVFGLFVGAIGAAGLVSACAVSAELGSDDDDNEVLEAGAPDPGSKSDGSASPPKGSSSGSSGGKSSSSSGGSSGTQSGSSSSSGGSSSGSSGVLTGPEEGTLCTEPGRVYTRSCGLCGKQKATCFPGATAAEMLVTAYDECSDEVVDGCAPGTVEQASACGFCGTRTRTCSNTCKWNAGACTGEQTTAAKCTLGTTRIESAGCPAGEYLTWTCREGDGPSDANRCTWLAPPVSECAAPVFPYVNAPALNATSTRDIGIVDQTLANRPNGSSGTCTTSTTGDRWRAITEIRNTTASTIKVEVSAPTGVDRILASYTSPPVSEATIVGCQRFNDSCLGAVAGADACLAGTTVLSIPANGKTWVLSADWLQRSATAYTLTVKRVP